MEKTTGMMHRAGLLVALTILGTTAGFAIARQVPRHPIAAVSPTTQTPPSSDTDGTKNLLALDLRNTPAPDFTLRDINGHTISLAKLKGHSVVLNFWATYCDPCQSEMPTLEALEKRYRERGLVVVGINQDEDLSPGKIAATAKHLGVTYPILLPDKTISRKYGGVDYLPETFYIDRNGTILVQTAGIRTQDQIERDIHKALASGA